MTFFFQSTLSTVTNPGALTIITVAEMIPSSVQCTGYSAAWKFAFFFFFLNMGLEIKV